MSAISKRFPGVVALERVDFDVAAGEIVGLIGENGAGKSTLMKILGGIHRADAGEISIAGAQAVMHSPVDAARIGVAIIHQEIEVIDTLDVAGNVFLGREPHRGGPLRLLDRTRMALDTERHLARIGARLSPRTQVRRLSAAQKQFVAIARALSMQARLLVLDEPTASLGSSEAERLFAVLRELRSGGAGIVYISHRLTEVEALVDRAVVLRDGRNAGTLPRDEITRDRLVQMMVGRALTTAPARGTTARSAPAAADERETAGRALPHAEAAAPPLPVPPRGLLQIDRVRTGRYPDAEVSLTVNAGEVLGVAGLVGAGRSELAEAICGVGTRVAGRVVLDGRLLAIESPRDAIGAGICLVPEDRRRHGVISAMTIRDNITLPALRSHARLGLIRRSAETTSARAIATNLAVKAASIEVAAATLSGGNQQKVVLGKWLSLRPRVIIFDEPTQGVDVAAKADIHRLIRQLANDGAAVVMISSDMEEIVAESDRVAVMHEGRVTGILDGASCTPESIMQLAVA
jgi:ribose transport system ATP-binding protein